jgi:hypothetical protein
VLVGRWCDGEVEAAAVADPGDGGGINRVGGGQVLPQPHHRRRVWA